MDRRHNKTFKVRSVATVADPAREKAEREKAEEMRIRDKEKLERQQVRSTGNGRLLSTFQDTMRGPECVLHNAKASDGICGEPADLRALALYNL